MSETLIRKRPGRPRLSAGEDTYHVSVRLPESLHYQACVMARQRRMDLSEAMRYALIMWLNNGTPGYGG